MSKLICAEINENFRNSCRRSCAKVHPCRSSVTRLISRLLSLQLSDNQTNDENVKRNCLDVDDVVKAGPGLSFIAYPEAIGLLPVCQLFSGMISQFFLVFELNMIWENLDKSFIKLCSSL